MRYFLLIVCLCWAGHQFAQDFRYTENISPAVAVTTGVLYGQAPFLNFPYSDENNTTQSDLVMDIYQPTGDLHDKRAAIIFAHSGGFIVGDRTHDDMVAICDSFARKGYVTATIDYRQGFYLFNNVPLHGIRAVYRGIQDGRAAVRFLRTNAAAYGIDPNQVYLAGSSAGAFISLQSIYLSDAELPAEVGVNTYTDLFIPRITPDLGLPDVGANLGVSGTPNGVVGLWGAVADPSWVDPEDDQPVFLAHGSADETVPFTIGPPFGAGTFPDVYGSAVIADELEANGASNYETYFVEGGEHEFHGTDNGSWENGQGGNTRWDTLVQRIATFLWAQHRPTADFMVATAGLQASFTDLTPGAVARRWSFGDGASSTADNPTHVYTAPGTYTATLYVENDILSWDTLSQEMVVDAALPLTWWGPPAARWSGKNAQITWEVSDVINVSHFTVEHAPADGSFTELGTVSATDGPVQRTYVFDHATPGTGQHFYRILAHDLDGSVSLSQIATLEAAPEVAVWPNPTSGLVTVSGAPPEQRSISVTNAYGQTFNLPVRAGQLDLSPLPVGVYFLRIGGQSAKVKVVRIIR